jgi:hypothetical protein
MSEKEEGSSRKRHYARTFLSTAFLLFVLTILAVFADLQSTTCTSLGRLAAFAILPFVSTYTEAIQDSALDYNSLLNEGLDQDIFPHLGQYAVRYSVAPDSPVPPLGCSVTVVNSLERHGARLFTGNALASANATFVKIKNSLLDVNASSLSTELQFIKNTSIQGGTNSLLPYGALQ